MTAVAEPVIEQDDQPTVIDLDALSPDQLADLFSQLRARFGSVVGDEPPTAIQALMRVMQEVQSIAKDGEFRETRNGQVGPVKYKFRGVDAVMKAVGPAVRRHQLLPVPWVDEIRQSEYKTAGGTLMKESVAFVTYKIYGPRGDFVEARMAGEKANSSDKSVSQSESVAYRQLWIQLLCIPTDEPDPDLTNEERGSVQDQAAAREAQQSSRQELLTTVQTTSTELRELLGAGEYDWLEWLVKVCDKDFGVDVTGTRAPDGPVEAIDLGKLRTKQLQLLWNRLNAKLTDERKARRVEQAMDLGEGS